MSYSAVIKQQKGMWVGWVTEIQGVNAQEETREELLASLLVSLVKAVEHNRRDALKLIGNGYEVVQLSP